jgi:hypothetical protein
VSIPIGMTGCVRRCWVPLQAFFADIYTEAVAAVPAAGHRALADIAALGCLRRHYTLNIDGLGEAAGMDTWHPDTNPDGALPAASYHLTLFLCLCVYVCICVAVFLSLCLWWCVCMCVCICVCLPVPVPGPGPGPGPVPGPGHGHGRHVHVYDRHLHHLCRTCASFV